ncbi:cystathionine beta-lyase [Glaciimonas sp. PAMC28666]|uniref:cystathionine beta-lyase n=1 Tax=Glaciimonas sp. PAMC28666 TaxID=2807626 RepID=UPI001963B301|nr:cystathionine beta-lyase [Glaciimonas sp. PAMC28666]QRX81471.1 cystathionine beta-lyase [Glaciimonas sp. PAMC28666]
MSPFLLKKLRPHTRLLKAGNAPAYRGGKAVNPPVVRASTVLFESVEELDAMRAHRNDERLFTYGARGNPTAFALEDVVSDIEGGFRTRLFPTGLAAIAMVFTTYLKPGDHVLIADCVYQPVRHFAETFMKKFGIEVTFFCADGSDIVEKARPETRMLYVECPGSLVYELCDMRALATLAAANNWLLVADNTWGSGLQYQPLALGADVSVIAATKYLSGHSDVMMGTVTTNEKAWRPLAEMSDACGMTVSPDDAYLVLRGIRTLAARLALHEQHALKIAQWLLGRAEVARVFCPALPDHPGHAIWQRDCQGTNGLVSFEFSRADRSAAARFVNQLTLFGIGASWGGYESLATISDLKSARTVTDWSEAGTIVRLHIGMEDPEDLIEDLAQAFAVVG